MEQENKQPSPGEILIIDDTLASLQLLADLLGEAGYAVRTAQDGEMGLLSAQAQAPDLILLDIRMPGMDGFEVCRRLKADPATAEIPVIFLSALQDTQNKMQGFQLGAVDYITKPYQASEVLARVRTHVELHQLQTVLKNKVVFRTMKLEQEIAERKQAEVALQESDILFRTLARVSPVGIFRTDPQGLGVYVNERWCEITGISQEQAKGTGWAQAVHPDDREWVTAKWYEAAVNNLLFKEEFRFQRPDGSIVWVLAQAAAEASASGEVAGYVGAVTDITERKRIEEALHAGEERYRRIFTDSTVVMLVIDPADGRIVDANAAACAYYGYAPGQLKAMKILDINTLSPEEVRAEIRRAEEKKKTHFDFCHRLANGNIRNVEVSSGPLEIEGHKLLLSVVTDVTERKQVEQEREQLLFKVSQNAAEMEAILASQNDVVLLYDTGMNVRRVNPSFLKIYGFDPVSLNVKDIIRRVSCRHPDGRPFVLEEQPTPRALRGEEVRQALFSVVRADGATAFVETSSRPMYVEGNIMGTVTVWHDITERKQAEDEARSAHELLAGSMQQMPVAYIQFDERFLIAEWNKAAENIFGFTRDEVLGKHPIGLFVQEELRQVIEDVIRKLLDGVVADYSASGNNVRKDGTVISCKWYNRPLRNKDGKIVGVICMAEDVTERLRAEEALRLQSEITANSAEGIALIKAGDGIIHYANRQFEMLFGYESGELTGKHISSINAPTEKSPQETAAEIIRAIEEHGVWNGEVLNRRKDGATLWTFANVSTFRHPELGTLLITYQRDITEKKKSEEVVWKQANFDMLTGLPNRHMFHDRLAQEIRKAARADQKLALMFIDLDRFKEVNDTLGHDMGDTLLVEAARRIGECVRATDMVARMGGDEFTVTLTDVVDVGSIERVALSILLKLAEPFHLGTEIAYVSGSVGITLYPDDAADMEELLKNADQAMYVAKGLGRNRHSYFTHELQVAAQTRMNLISDLRGALTANQFRVYFQPIVDMTTGAIHKAEALIRWQHPQRGLVNPMEFIPLAEETGLIFEIGDWVFKESALWVKRWRELHHAEFQVSVNKSPVQFYKMGDKDSAWLAHLRDLELPGQSIVIEITEGLLLGAESAIGDALFTLRDAGIQIAIDDFGTGYSSLAYLNRFNIDYLKIDQSFTRNLTPESNDMALSEAIIVMAHKLGLKVIAEGVETQMQRDLLAAVGCDYAQGYLYSRPVPPEEFEMLLKNSETKVQ